MQVYHSSTTDKKYFKSTERAKKSMEKKVAFYMIVCVKYRVGAIASTMANFLDRELTFVEELYIFVICGGASYISPESFYGKYRDSIS